jgi:hypothetical protein
MAYVGPTLIAHFYHLKIMAYVGPTLISDAAGGLHTDSDCLYDNPARP